MQRPKLFRLTVSERKDAVERLITDSAPSADFFLMLALSVLIVVSGLHMNNAAVIIGGMVVAPLLSPILSMSMGVVMADFRLIARGSRTMLLSAIMVIAFAAIITLFFPDRALNAEIVSRSSASLGHLVIAIASGVAAAFALAKPNLSATIPGIAVSVSLLPPITVSGVGIALADWNLTSGSLTLFLVNFIGIVLAATVVFSLHGFYPVRNEAEEKLTEEEKEREKERKAAEAEKKSE